MKETNTISLLLGVGKIIRLRMEKEFPYSFTKYETLRLLKKETTLTMRAIADNFKITAPSATAMVNELVKANLVVRAGNKEDRREVVLGLSAHGKKVQLEFEKKRKKIFEDVFSVLSKHDRAELDKILSKIIVETEAKQS